MANLGLFYPNRVTGATITGGSWLAQLPATNVGTRALGQVARSTNAATSSTKLRFDLLVSRSLRAFALANHNLSTAAQWRILLGTSSGAGDVLTTSWFTAILATYEAGFTALGVEDGTYQRNGFAVIQVLSQAYSARYVTIEIDDTTNTDGYVQIGRAVIAGGYIPTINASYGLRDSWKDFTTIDHSETGVLWYTPRRRLRNVSFVLEHLDLTSGVTLHEMQRMLGMADEVLYAADIEDMAYTQRYGFLATHRELSALEYPFFSRRTLPLSLDEIG